MVSHFKRREKWKLSVQTVTGEKSIIPVFWTLSINPTIYHV